MYNTGFGRLKKGKIKENYGVYLHTIKPKKNGTFPLNEHVMAIT